MLESVWIMLIDTYLPLLLFFLAFLFCFHGRYLQVFTVGWIIQTANRSRTSSVEQLLVLLHVRPYVPTSASASIMGAALSCTEESDSDHRIPTEKATLAS